MHDLTLPILYSASINSSYINQQEQKNAQLDVLLALHYFVYISIFYISDFTFCFCLLYWIAELALDTRTSDLSSFS